MTRFCGVLCLGLIALAACNTSVASGEERVYQTASEAHAAALEAARADLERQVYKARVDSVTPMDIYLGAQWKLRDQMQDLLSEPMVAQETSGEAGQVVVTLEVPVDSIPLALRKYYREYGHYIRGQGLALCPRVSILMPELDLQQLSWQDQVLTALGEGKAKDGTPSAEKSHQAFNAAKAEAMRNLAAMVEVLPVSSDRTVRSLIAANETARHRVHTLIGKATPTQVDFVADDECRVILELPLLVLPEALIVESSKAEADEDAKFVQARALARKNAQQIAYRRLSRDLYDIPVKVDLTIRDYAARDQRLAQDLENALHNAEVVRERSLRDGTFQLEVALDVARLPRKVTKAAQAILGSRYVVTATGRPE